MHVSLATPSVAVIGAGLAGLTVAHDLRRAGLPVTVLEKSRGLGGRLATRRVDGFAFDHGAPFLAAGGRALAACLEALAAAGSAETWHPRAPNGGGPGEVVVGRPGMSGLLKPIAAGIDVRLQVRAERLVRTASGWRLLGAGGGEVGAADIVLIAVPAAQARDLLATAPETLPLADAIAHVEMDPVWTLMAVVPPATDRVPAGPADVLIGTGPLRVLVDNGTKPGRKGGRGQWTAHASSAASRRLLEADREAVIADLVPALRSVSGVSGTPTFIAAHRWRYGLTATPFGRPALFDSALGIGLAGDWCLGAEAADAFDSAGALAGEVLAHVGRAERLDVGGSRLGAALRAT